MVKSELEQYREWHSEDRWEIDRLRADNAAMFKNLEDQTTRGLQMVAKWQQAEARLAKVADKVEWLAAANEPCDRPDFCQHCELLELAALAAAQPKEKSRG